jgi:hypothetical protein
MMKLKPFLVGLLIVSLFQSSFSFAFARQQEKKDLLLKTNTILLPTAQVQKTITIHNQFSRNNLRLNYTKDGLLIQMKDCDSTISPDQPKMPRFERDILIDPNFSVAYIKTLSLQSTSFPLPDLPVVMVREPQPYNNIFDQPLKSKKPFFTNQVSYFPQENFTYYSSHTNGEHKLHLNIHPAYMIQQKLYLVTNLTIEIGLCRTVDPAIPNKNKMDAVILVPDEMVESANQLKKMQEKDGYKVTIAKVSDMAKLNKADRPKSETYQGASTVPEEKRKILAEYNEDLACRIITYLQELVKKDAIDYLTLLGDATLIPPSNYIRSGYNMEVFDSWTPTDMFYMSPLATEDEFLMPISCGRIPVRDAAEASRAIQKIARYRAELKSDWFQNAVVMGGDPFQDDYMGELMVSSTINKDSMNGFTIEKYFKTQGIFRTKPVLDLLKNANKGWIYGIGHGSGSGLALEPGMIMADDMMRLPTASRLPVFLSIACLNGAYDTRLFKGDFFQKTKALGYPTSFSEAIVLSEGGAIAYVGGARNNYGALDDVAYLEGILSASQDASYMGYVLDKFCEAYHNKISVLGDIAKDSLIKYLETPWGFDDTPGINTFFGFILMGDPTIKLPDLQPVQKNTVPELKHNNKYKKGPYDLPFIPIDEGLKLDIKTDAKSVKYYLSDYDTEKKNLLSVGAIVEKTSNGFNHFFEKYGKSRLSIRIETEDYKESRIVFHGRYNHDLVVETRNDFYRLRPGEKKRYMATIRNDGIFDEKDITVQVNSAGGNREYKYPILPTNGSRYVWIDFSEEKSGEYPMTISAKPLTDELMETDNEVMRKINVVNQGLVRIGYLSESIFQDYNNTDIFEQIDEVSKILRGKNTALDLIPVSFHLDSLDASTQLDRLMLDVLLVDSPDAFDMTLSQYADVFDNFTKKGGKILCIGSFAKNPMEFSSSALQSRFGISEQASFNLKDWAPTKKEIFINSSFEQNFTKKSYSLSSNLVLDNDNETISDYLTKEATIIAQSEDNQFKVVQNGNFFTLTGLLDWADSSLNPEKIDFLVELFAYMTQEPRKPYIQSIEFDSPLGIKNQRTNLMVQFVNPSDQEWKDLSLIINSKEGDSSKIPVPLLLPYSSLTLKHELDWRGISGNKEYTISFQDQIEKVFYSIDPKNEPDSPPKLEITTKIPSETWESEIMVSGKVSKGAKLFLGIQEFAVNTDNNFLIPIALLMGKNHFTLKAVDGSLDTMQEFTIQRLKKVELSLRIGDYSCIQSGKLIRLQEPPQIFKGTTFVPVRLIADSFHCQINWETKEQKITITTPKLEIILWVGKKIARLNGQEIAVQAPPFIGKSGRTLVPMRFIAESFGATVTWNSDLMEIGIIMGIVEPPLQPTSAVRNFLVETEDSREILSSKAESDFVNPLCYDFDGINLYSLTKKGIVIMDKELVYIKTIPLPNEYFKQTNLEDLNMLFSQPRRSLLKVSEKYIILTDSYDNILIFNKNDMTLIKRIRSQEFALSSYTGTYFSMIMDLEILGDTLYILNYPSGLLQIDIITSEISTKLRTISYPYDLELKNEKIFLMGTNQFQIMDLNGATLKEGKVEDYPFLYAMTVSANDEFIARDIFSDAIYLINQDGKIKKRYPVTTKMGLLFEKMSLHGEILFALPVFSSQSEPRVHSEILQLDAKFKIIHSAGIAAYEELKKKKDTYLNADNLWILHDGSILLSFDGPFMDDQLKRISKDRKKKETINLAPDNENISSYGSFIASRTLNEKDQFGCLYDSYFSTGKLVLQKTDIFQDEITYVLLKPKSSYYMFSCFDFDDSTLYGYDIYSGNILVFDLATGEETNQISPILPDQSLFGIKNLQLINKKLYALDSKNKAIHIFTIAGLHEAQIAFQTLLLPRNDAITQMVVSKSSEIYILDSVESRIYLVTEQGIKKQWGEKQFLFPSHFSVLEDKLLVNDWGNQLIYLMSLDQPSVVKLNPALYAYPESIEKTITLEKQIIFKLFISLVDTTEPLVLTLPGGITTEAFQEKTKSQEITFKVDLEKISIENPMNNQIIIQSGSIEKIIPVHIKKNKVDLEGYNQSNYLMLPDSYYLSRSPIVIKNGLVALGEDVLKDVYGFSIQKNQNGILLSSTEMTFSITNGSQKAFILTKSGKIEIDLLRKVEISNRQYLVPIDTIFQMLNIPIRCDLEKFYSSIV